MDKIKKSETEEKENLLKKFAKMFGIDTVEKGTMTDNFNKKSKSTLFWNAFNTLEELLSKRYWNGDYQETIFVSDEETIKTALQEFNDIISKLLLEEQSITKAIKPDGEILKAGKKMSLKNKEMLQGIYESLGIFLSEFKEGESSENKEETGMKEEDIKKMVDDSVVKALEPITKAITELAKTENQDKETENEEETKKENDAEKVKTEVQKMIDTSITKAVEPISAALENLMKSRGLPSNLGDTQAVQKSTQHYLKGIL